MKIEKSESTYPSVVAELERCGLLLQQDKKLTSVVGLVTGESLPTSWWSHPRAQEIFNILQRLDDIALPTRLVAKKVTLVHRRLWPALLTVATSNEAWQRPVKETDAKRIQERLLAVAREVHTESGKHVVVLEPWSDWAKREHVKPIAIDDARAALEQAVLNIGGTSRLLPWHH